MVSSDLTGTNFTNDTDKLYIGNTLIRETLIDLRDGWPPQISMKSPADLTLYVTDNLNYKTYSPPVSNFINSVSDDISVNNINLSWKVFKTLNNTVKTEIAYLTTVLTIGRQPISHRRDIIGRYQISLILLNGMQKMLLVMS